MLVLGIDTSARTGSVALCDRASLIGEFTLGMERQHSERLMPALDSLLAVSGVGMEDVELIAVARGPGPFTGLRVGITTAKALAYGLGLPAVGVPTLDAIAYGHHHSARDLCVLLDARKQEVYAARYEAVPGPVLETPLRWLRCVGAHRCTPVHDVLGEIERPTLFVGDGAAAYRCAIAETLGDLASFGDEEAGVCRAWAVATLGDRLHRDQPTTAAQSVDLSPLYLRRPEAEVKLGQSR